MADPKDTQREDVGLAIEEVSRRRQIDWAKRDGRGNPIIADSLYYVQDARQVVGNCVLWWGRERSGYVCELNKAGLYTGTEVVEMRETDVPWPKDFVLERTILHVRREHLRG